MEFRRTSASDLPLLAELNQQLILDEGAPNPMSVRELEARMRSWLECEYEAVLFLSDGSVVGYALFRPSEEGIYLRQFFVSRALRRRGLGRAAIQLLRERVLPKGAVVTVEVFLHNQRGLQFWRAVGFTDYLLSLRSVS